MPRLFIALRLPSDNMQAFGRLCRGLPRARWMSDDEFHLTLRFIGEVDHPTFCEIGEDLMAIAMPPFELCPSGLGTFPKRGEMQSLWVGIETSEALVKLKRQIDHVVTNAGVAKEERKFTPHITIARFNYPPEPVRFARYLTKHNTFRGKPFPVSSFQLISSHLHKNRAEHTLEAEYDFVRGTIERD